VKWTSSRRHLVAAATLLAGMAATASMPPTIPAGDMALHWIPSKLLYTDECWDSLVAHDARQKVVFETHGYQYDQQMPDSGTVYLETFLEALHQRRGFTSLHSHGSSQDLAVEAYATETERDIHWLNRIVPLFWWAVDGGHIYRGSVTVGDDIVHTIGIRSSFITHADPDPVHLEGQSPVVFVGSCNSYGGNPSICDALRLEGASATIGYLEVIRDTSPISDSSRPRDSIQRM
jgi:hypothetical protein